MSPSPLRHRNSTLRPLLGASSLAWMLLCPAWCPAQQAVPNLPSQAAHKENASTPPPFSTSAGALEAPDAAPIGNLPESFRSALQNTYQTNPQIKSQQQIVAQRDEGVNQALAGWLPRVTANVQAGRSRAAYDTPDFTYGNTSTKSLQVDQPLFNGGQTVATTHREENQVYAARADLRNIEEQVLLRGITSYMDVVRDRAILDLSRQNVDVLRKQLQGTKDRFKVGEVTKTDVAQSAARLSRAEADSIQAEGGLNASIATFERTVGYTPETLAMPETFPELPAKLEDALRIAQRDNPSIIAYQFRSQSAENDVNVNEAGILPSLSLQGAVTRQTGYGVSVADNFDQDSVLLNLSLPLYQSGAEYSRVRAAKARASQLKFDAGNALDATREATIQAWKDVETSVATIRSTEDGIRAAQIALDGVRQEQLYGSRTVLDVLDAEQELFTQRVDLVRAQRNRVVAIFTLLQQLGRLTPETLTLGTPSYDPTVHYDEVRYKVAGF